MSANETQVAGSHYQTEYQHWDAVLDILENRYLEGQVTKYVTRWRKKNGVEDLRKALHFLDKLIEAFTEGRVAPITSRRYATAHSGETHGAALARYFAAHPELSTEPERMVIVGMARWADGTWLAITRHRLLDVIAAAEPDGAATPAYVDQDR